MKGINHAVRSNPDFGGADSTGFPYLATKDARITSSLLPALSVSIGFLMAAQTIRLQAAR